MNGTNENQVRKIEIGQKIEKAPPNENKPTKTR